MKTTSLALILTTALSLAAFNSLAQAETKTKEGKPHFSHKAERAHGGWFKDLDLTDSQKQQIRDLMKASKAERPDRQAFFQQQQQLEKLTSADYFDEQAARQLLEQRNEQELNRLKLQHQLYQVLTPEQKVELDAKKAKRLERTEKRRVADKSA